jgi:homoserine kinase
VIATPQLALETKRAREALPSHVSMTDAVANVQRTALLLQSIAAGDRRWLREAFHDRLHQPYRAPLVPGLDAALALDHPALHGVFLSGAGPSIAAIVGSDHSAIIRKLEAVYEAIGVAAQVRAFEVHQPFDGGVFRGPALA